MGVFTPAYTEEVPNLDYVKEYPLLQSGLGLCTLYEFFSKWNAVDKGDRKFGFLQVKRDDLFYLFQQNYGREFTDSDYEAFRYAI